MGRITDAGAYLEAVVESVLQRLDEAEERIDKVEVLDERVKALEEAIKRLQAKPTYAPQSSPFARLARGVNIDLVAPSDIARISDATLRNIAAQGVTAVRVHSWMKHGGAGSWPAYMSFGKRVIAAGMAYVYTPFGSRSGEPLNQDPSVSSLSDLVKLVKQEGFGPEFIVQTSNEPFWASSKSWCDAETALVNAARAIDPQRPILRAGNGREGSFYRHVTSLVSYTNPPEDNLVAYDLHYYEHRTSDTTATGYQFTHQGKTWGNDQYPAGVSYTRGQWLDLMAADMKAVSDWAARNKTRVVIGEFGVMTAANTLSKVAWLDDVTSVFKSNGIPYLYWDLDKSFSIAARRQDGALEIAPQFAHLFKP